MNLKGVLEGLLYVTGDEGLTKEKIMELLELSKDDFCLMIEEMNKDYENKNRGFRIEVLGGKYKLVTKKEHSIYYKKLIESERNENLTQSSLEVLAIIAYNMPITRTNIEEIRGVDSSYIIRKLVFLNLIEEKGRSDLPGRPILYGITDKFLDYLGLKSIEDLPKFEKIDNKSDDIELYDSKYVEN